VKLVPAQDPIEFRKLACARKEPDLTG
jgi:hypothetical protein